MLNPHSLHPFHLPNMHAVRNLRHLLAPTRRHSSSISRHLSSSSSAQQWLQSIHTIPAGADMPEASRDPTPPDPAEPPVGVSGAEEPEDPPGGGDASVSRVEPDGAVRTTVSPGVVFQRSERKRRGKEKVAWVCNNCGASRGQWWGMCPSCKEWDTARKVAEFGRPGGIEMEIRGWLPRDAGGEEPQSLMDVNKGMSDLNWRLPLPGIFGMEVARVLGGGVVPGSLILVGGDPGVGKSTLLLQIAGLLSEENGTKGSGRVLYVSGEESIDQIKNRADRMRITSNGIFLCSSTGIKDILEKVRTLSPQALIVDSVQTVYLEGISGSAGNLMQVKECTSALLRCAKQTNIPVFLIGHVTKTGDLAGPRALEHIVDAVLYMEGERNSSYRLLRSVKNRFGSTDELGVFEMSQSGLQAVLNPSEMFLSENYFDSEVLAGLAVAVILDGSRSFLIEIQALCVPDSSNPWHFNGVQKSRADMIASVLMKQVGLKLQGFAIYLNVVSGFKLTETAGDLAIAAAICSSFLEFAIPHDVAFIGEVGLGGELRTVPRMDKRLSAVSKLGFKTCIIPASALKSLNDVDTGMKITGCRNLKEVIQAICNFKDENGGRALG